MNSQRLSSSGCFSSNLVEIKSKDRIEEVREKFFIDFRKDPAGGCILSLVGFAFCLLFHSSVRQHIATTRALFQVGRQVEIANFYFFLHTGKYSSSKGKKVDFFYNSTNKMDTLKHETVDFNLIRPSLTCK